MKESRIGRIIKYLRENPGASRSDISANLGPDISPATLKRDLASLIVENVLIMEGQKRGARYYISPIRKLFMPIDIDVYFQKEIDERTFIGNYSLL